MAHEHILEHKEDAKGSEKIEPPGATGIIERKDRDRAHITCSVSVRLKNVLRVTYTPRREAAVFSSGMDPGMILVTGRAGAIQPNAYPMPSVPIAYPRPNPTTSDQDSTSSLHRNPPTPHLLHLSCIIIVASLPSLHGPSTFMATAIFPASLSKIPALSGSGVKCSLRFRDRA